MMSIAFSLLVGLLGTSSDISSVPSFISKQMVAVIESGYSEKLSRLSFKVHFAKAEPVQNNGQRESEHCQAVIYSTFYNLPEDHTTGINDLTITFDPESRRGLSGRGKMILRCINMRDKELSAVMVHEVGHIVDTTIFQGASTSGPSEFTDFGEPIFENDLSVPFYRISWKNSKTTQNDASDLDFVSKYAATDPFEDFAETYLFYRLHGEEFRYLAKGNEALFEKYMFMKKYVFNREEFGSLPEKSVAWFSRPFDATVLPY